MGRISGGGVGGGGGASRSGDYPMLRNGKE